MTAYRAKITKDAEGGFLIEFPDLPGAVTQAATRSEALERAADCLRTHLKGLIRLGALAPAPARSAGTPVELPVLESAKLRLYLEFQASGLKKAQLAARLAIPRAHVDRLFDFDHASRMNQIEKAFRVLGKTLILDVRDAA